MSLHNFLHTTSRPKTSLSTATLAFGSRLRTRNFYFNPLVAQIATAKAARANFSVVRRLICPLSTFFRFNLVSIFDISVPSVRKSQFLLVWYVFLIIHFYVNQSLSRCPTSAFSFGSFWRKWREMWKSIRRTTYSKDTSSLMRSILR